MPNLEVVYLLNGKFKNKDITINWQFFLLLLPISSIFIIIFAKYNYSKIKNRSKSKQVFFLFLLTWILVFLVPQVACVLIFNASLYILLGNTLYLIYLYVLNIILSLLIINHQKKNLREMVSCENAN